VAPPAALDLGALLGSLQRTAANEICLAVHLSTLLTLMVEKVHSHLLREALACKQPNKEIFFVAEAWLRP
jgi:hypothetical protein